MGEGGLIWRRDGICWIEWKIGIGDHELRNTIV